MPSLLPLLGDISLKTMVRNLGPLSQRLDPRDANLCFTSLPTAEEREVPVKLRALPAWGSTLVQEVTVRNGFSRLYLKQSQ